jgi:filamentous hemagglutinin family protein
MKLAVMKTVLSNLTLTILSLGVTHPVLAQVLPAADNINTQVQTQPAQFNITGGTKSQDGANLFHSFDRFNLDRDQLARFIADPVTRNIFARIRGGSSAIDGQLQITGATANLFLFNPQGILFGPNVQLNLPAMFSASTATGLGFGNGNWEIDSNDSPQALVGLPQNLIFAVSQPGTIANLGNLTVKPEQAISLTAGTVINAGTVKAPAGQVTIAAVPGSTKVRLSQTGSILSFALNPSPNQPLTPETVTQLLTKGSGIQNAQTLEVTANGKIQLRGAGISIVPQENLLAGQNLQAGIIDTSSPNVGGQVQILGDQISLQQATILAQGDRAAGKVLIGGDFQGQGTLPQASVVKIDATSQINVSAKQNGNAGQVVVWSDRDTVFQGNILAKGGALFGDGGLVEVSGKQRLAFTGQVDVSAVLGKTGKLLLDPQDIIIGNTAQSALPDNTTTAEPFLLSQNIFSQVNGEIELNADRRIWIQKVEEAGLLLGTGGKITLRAGELVQSDTPLLSAGRSLEIQAPQINLKSINTTLSNDQAGAVTLEGREGGLAEKVVVANIITPQQDVKINARSIKTDVIITSSGKREAAAGEVLLQAQDQLQATAILTNGQAVRLNSPIDSPMNSPNRPEANSTVRVGPVISLGGDVTIAGGQVNTGLIFTTPNRTGDAGNIQISAIGDIRTQQLEANGNQIGRSGKIDLRSDLGDLSIDSIQAKGLQGGGQVFLAGDTVRISGLRYEQLPGSSTFINTSITADESVTIQQRGGSTNQPFIIGDSAYNGTNGQIIVGNSTQSLNQGSFAIQPETVQYQPLESKALTIVAENQMPFFPGLQDVKLLQRNVEKGSRTRFSLAQLGVVEPQDPNQDRTQLYIRSRGQSSPLAGQLLDVYGRPITTAVPVRLSDRLTYIAPSSNITPNLFEIIALDVPPTPEALDRYPRLVLRLAAPPIPEQEPIAPEINKPKPAVADGTPLSNVSAQEAARLDNELSQDYVKAGIGEGENSTPPDGMAVVRDIEQKTKTRSALIYFRTQADALEITLITSRGRFRKRVPVLSDRLLETASTFRREVTNPIKTHTTSYLTSAQKLYQWMIEPIYADLYSQGISNLVFLPEGGLRSIPYAALHNGRQFLIEQYSVALMPSLGLTKTGYQTLQDTKLFAIGISAATQDQKPLPMVQAELTTVGKIWPDDQMYFNQDATLATLQDARKKYPFQIVHLATHANFSATNPKEAYIQLWNEQLKLEQIRQLGWNSPPVDLLLLSACRTAIGNKETELGFAGLAVQTGVKTAVASLWYVNDTATSALVSQFYQILRSANIKAEPLRQAQLGMLRGKIVPNGNKISGLFGGIEIPVAENSQVNDRTFRHPYYWAAFTVIGNPW